MTDPVAREDATASRDDISTVARVVLLGNMRLLVAKHCVESALEAEPPLSERGRWTRDAEHNPDPLSPAQASLVGE